MSRLRAGQVGIVAVQRRTSAVVIPSSIRSFSGDCSIFQNNTPRHTLHKNVMAKVIEFLPELQGEEMVYIQRLLNDMDDEKARTFASVYRARRKDPQIVLLTALVGFLGISGIHRFILGQVGMGILYLFTAGLCFIGTIVDLVNYQRLAFEANQQMAHEVMAMLR